MGNSPQYDIKGMVSDPDFRGLDPKSQILALQKASPGFARLPLETQVVYIKNLREQSQQPQKESAIGGFMKRAIGTDQPITDLGNIAGGLATHPMDTITSLLKGLTAPQEEALQRSSQEYQKGNLVNALGYQLEGRLPVVGPAVGRAASEFGGGNTVGAAEDIYAPLALGALTGGVAKAAGKVAEASLPDVTAAQRLASNAKIQGAVGNLAEKAGVQAETAPAVQEAAQRVLSRGRATAAINLEKMASKAASEGAVEPIDAAKGAVQALKGQAGFQTAIEKKLYPEIYKEADSAGVTIEPQNTAKVSSAIVGRTSPAQAKFGASSLTPSDVAGVSKIAKATSPEEAVRQRFEGVLEQMPDSMRFALFGTGGSELSDLQTSAIAKALGPESMTVPFSTFDEARQGIGKVIRTLKDSQNPENASRVAALTRIQDAMQKDIQASLEQHPELRAKYDLAHSVTTERHDAIDRKMLRGFFTSERTQKPAESIVRAILKPDNYQQLEDIRRGLVPGKSTLNAVATIDDPAISAKLVRVLADNGKALGNLRKIVVDEVKASGTSASTTPGVLGPEFNYQKMIDFMESRAGTRVILGKKYDELLGQLREQRAASIAASDPAYSSFLNSTAKGMSEDQFLSKVASDRDYAAKVASITADMPEVRSSIVRNLIDGITQKSMASGNFGEAGSFMDARKFASEFNKSFSSMAKFGDLQAVSDLNRMAQTIRAIETRRELSRVPRIRGFLRMLSHGPGGLYLHETTGNPALVITPNELAKAINDPRLARLLRQASETQVSSAAAAKIGTALSAQLGRTPEQNGGGQ